MAKNKKTEMLKKITKTVATKSRQGEKRRKEETLS